MPKINVYLSDELAAAVKQAGVPVSPVCQQALTDAVAKIATARRAVEAIRNPALSQTAIVARVGAAVGDRLTVRLGTALDLARVSAGVEAGGDLVGTGQLMLGLLDEGANLALAILQSLDTDLDELRSATERRLSQLEASPDSQPAPDGESAVGDESAAGGGSSAGAEPGQVSLQLHKLTMPSRGAIATAIEASIGLGHNYIGCEHLLLGLLADPGSQAGRALAESGVTEADVKRALTGALAGFAHGRRWSGAQSAGQLAQLTSRMEELERRLAALGG